MHCTWDCYNCDMRRALILVTVVLLACQAASSLLLPTQDFTQPSPTVTQSAVPQPTGTPSPSPSPTLPVVMAAEYSVSLHPDGPLFVGDQVSIEVISSDDVELEEHKVQIRVKGVSSADLGSAEFGEYGIGKRRQATFTWVWDTSGYEPGAYRLEFQIQPSGEGWQQTVYLSPSAEVPKPEPHARWETINIECCQVNYITSTESARDLPFLLDLLEQQAESASRMLAAKFDQRIAITFLPRVLGHGGFASNEIYVSYLADNYAGNDIAQVLHHEMIHILDGSLGGELRPSLLVEGLAVYLSGGHFKKEPLLSRAAALLELGWYLPLSRLVDSFYSSQHEIGYLEGAALVQFMVDRYGWEAFDNFYRDIKPQPSEKESRALDDALNRHFGLSLDQLEVQFLTALKKQHINPDMYEDVYLTVLYYQAVRRYQQRLDPSAYFLTAWLPEGEQMRERGIVADYLRRPSMKENFAIESLLVQVDNCIRAGDYKQAEKTLSLVDHQLDQIQDDLLIGSFHPLLDNGTSIK